MASPSCPNSKAPLQANVSSRPTHSATSTSIWPRFSPLRAGYLLVAIDRATKFAFVELHEKVTRSIAGNFLHALVKAVPYKIHTVLTDNGTHFTSPGNTCSAAAEIRRAMDCGELFRAHGFEYACAQLYIDHRLTKPRHPWTNGQVERMNRTIKEATVKRFHYDTHDQLRSHLSDFVNAYNFGRRLKTLKGLTPTKPSAKPGQPSPNDSPSTRSTKCRD